MTSQILYKEICVIFCRLFSLSKNMTGESSFIQSKKKCNESYCSKGWVSFDRFLSWFLDKFLNENILGPQPQGPFSLGP